MADIDLKLCICMSIIHIQLSSGGWQQAFTDAYPRNHREQGTVGNLEAQILPTAYLWAAGGEPKKPT